MLLGADVGIIRKWQLKKSSRHGKLTEKHSDEQIHNEERPVARRKGLTFYQKKKKLNPTLIKDIFEMIVGGMIAVFLAFVIVFSIGMRTSVVGDSMEPILFNGQ